MVLLAVYSAGLGIPFFLAGWSIEWFFSSLARIKHHFRAIEIGSGVLLVALGFLVMTNSLTDLNSYFSFLNDVVETMEGWLLVMHARRTARALGGLLCLLVLGCGEPDGAASHEPPPPEPAPDFTLPRLVEGRRSASRACAAGRCWWTSGRPGVRPASSRCPLFNAYHREHGAEVPLLGVATDAGGADAVAPSPRSTASSTRCCWAARRWPRSGT